MKKKQVLIRPDLHRPAKVRAASQGLTLLEYLSDLIEADLQTTPKTERPHQAA